MSIQLESTPRLETASINPKITIDNDRLQALQKRVATATVLIPLIGSIIAVGLLPFRGIGLVEIGLVVSLYSLSAIGITVGYHRYFSHRAFKTSTPIQVILLILGGMAAEGPVIHWASFHRCHHKYSDLPEDPHSPYIHEGKKLGWWHGLWHSHIGWMLNSKMVNSGLFAKDLLRDPVIVKLNKMYLVWVALGLVIPAAIGGAIDGTWMGAIDGLLWGGFVRLFLAHHFIWTIGSIAHLFGNRPLLTHDFSTNNPWLVIQNFGESWHNNHHAFPNSAMFGLEWWQIDLGAWTIRILEKLGLVWDVNSPSRLMIESKRKAKSLAV